MKVTTTTVFKRMGFWSYLSFFFMLLAALWPCLQFYCNISECFWWVSVLFAMVAAILFLVRSYSSTKDSIAREQDFISQSKKIDELTTNNQNQKEELNAIESLLVSLQEENTAISEDDIKALFKTYSAEEKKKADFERNLSDILRQTDRITNLIRNYSSWYHLAEAFNVDVFNKVKKDVIDYSISLTSLYTEYDTPLSATEKNDIRQIQKTFNSFYEKYSQYDKRDEGKNKLNEIINQISGIKATLAKVQ